MTPHVTTARAGDAAATAPGHALRLPLAARLEALAGELAERPDAAVALAAVRGTETAHACRGTADTRTREPVTADTGFELGSVTKTFTALLLAEMAARGEVRDTDPVAAYLPRGSLPRRHGEAITLGHLSTHTSGLPRLPAGFLWSALPTWYTNPYARFSRGDLLRSLARTRLRHRPGTRVLYSNAGVGLLGHALATAAGCDGPDGYARALTARVLRPLGMTYTTCAPGAGQATGHLHGRPRPPWLIPGLPGAGAVRAGARDLLRYLTAHLGEPPAADDDAGDANIADDGTPLRAALRDVVRPRLARPDGDRLCLVWNLRTVRGTDLLFHSGGTRGFTAFLGFAPQTRTGLAALTNSGPTLRSTFIRSAYLALRELALPAEPDDDAALLRLER